MLEDYDVGKNKPPAQYKWKKGQSGNPIGSSKKARERAEKARRLKAMKPLEEMVLEELCEQVAPNVDGKQQQMLAWRGLAKALVRDGLGGKAVDRRQTLKLLYEWGIVDLLKVKSEEAEFDKQVLTPAEERMLEQVKAEHEFMKNLPDKGAGWEDGFYDLEPYVTESGETDYRMVPTVKYKAMKAAQGRKEDEATATANEQAAGGTQEVFLGRAGSILPEMKLDGEGDSAFENDDDGAGGPGFDEGDDPLGGENIKDSGKRPNETFVDYSNAPGNGLSHAKSSAHCHQPDAAHGKDGDNGDGKGMWPPGTVISTPAKPKGEGGPGLKG